MGRLSYEYKNFKEWLKSVSIYLAVRKQEAEEQKNPSLAISRRIREDNEDLNISQAEIDKYKVSSYPDKNGYIFAIVFGIALLVWSGTYLFKTEEAKSWPTTNGKIIASGIASRYAKRGEVYEANIKFGYIVNGQEYTSNKISFGEFSLSDPNYARTIDDKYPLNQVVTVHYNPGNPSEAILEFKNASLYFYSVVGFLFLLGGLISKRKYNECKNTK